MVRLTTAHHLILWCALDGLDLATPLLGMDEVIGSGEKFAIVPPTPPDKARKATLELLDAGAIRVSFIDWETGDERWLDVDEARKALADPATWNLNVPAPVAHLYEIVITPAGEEMFEEAHQMFGQEMDRSGEKARERSAEFHRRHPDFVKKNAKHLRDMTRWVITGARGPQPKPPRFD